MENIRAYTIIHNICDISDEFFHIPENVMDDESSVGVIRRDGFVLFLKTDHPYEKVHEFFMQTLFLKDLELVQIEQSEYEELSGAKREVTEKNTLITKNITEENSEGNREIQSAHSQQNIISVSMIKLDKLMDLVGEMVISEDMVIQNPDLKGMELENFQKQHDNCKNYRRDPGYRYVNKNGSSISNILKNAQDRPGYV